MLVDPVHTSFGVCDLPFSRTMNLLCWIFEGLASRRMIDFLGKPASLINSRLSLRGKLFAFLFASTIKVTSTPRVEVAAQPFQRLGLLLGRKFVRAKIVEFSRIGLTARDP